MASPPWTDLPGFTARSILPSEDAANFETHYPGFIVQQIATVQALIEARLRKRYQLPFGAPAPETAINWLVCIVTLRVFQRRGFNPASAENQLIVDAAKEAAAEIKEAADSKDGLFDLPLIESQPGASGVVNGGPLGYAEQSPWTWTALQWQDATLEDQTVGGGSRPS